LGYGRLERHFEPFLEDATMKLSLLASTLAAMLALPVAAQALPPGGQDAIGLIDRWLAAQREFEHVPGLSAAIVVGQDTVWSRGYGFSDYARKQATQPDTIYSICSISKLFTSVAVMQQWEAGRLHLDDEIAGHLPEFTLSRSDPAGGPITIEALLTHSAGLPRESAHAYWTAPDFVFPTREQLFGDLKTQATFMNAGERWQYSNLGMAVLGELVARRSGEPYEAYVQAHILAPLGLKDTRPYMPMEQYGRRLAQGFAAVQRDGSRAQVKPFEARAVAPAAGFTSTVLDLARFAAWQFRLRKSAVPEVLRPATLRNMQRIHYTDPEGKVTWGLGFAVVRDGAKTVAGHGGICPGYLSGLSLALEDEVAVVAMTNANDNESMSRYTRPMRQLMLMGLKLPAAKDPAALAPYAGEYGGFPWGSGAIIVPWGDGLAVVHIPNRDPAGSLELLQASGPDRFVYKREDGSLANEMRFERDAQGKVIGYVVWGQSVKKVSP
jgi:CubicO group peptidase (beta-lactamase class C family)